MRFYRDDAEVIKKAANHIAAMYDSTYDRIVATMNYVLWTPQNPGGLIKYVPDIDQPTCKREDCKRDPVTAIMEGMGDCEEIGGANASILKAMGIPSQVVSFGWLWTGEEWVGHVWVEAWDDNNLYVMETTGPEIHVFDIDQNPYEVLTEYVPVDYIRGY